MLCDTKSGWYHMVPANIKASLICMCVSLWARAWGTREEKGMNANAKAIGPFYSDSLSYQILIWTAITSIRNRITVLWFYPVTTVELLWLSWPVREVVTNHTLWSQAKQTILKPGRQLAEYQDELTSEANECPAVPLIALPLHSVH